MNNIFFDNSYVTRQERETKYKQKGKVLWFTGLSGSGKTTIAKAVERDLFEKNTFVCVLDGDNLRHGINSDLKFSLEDRAENIRRTAEIAALLAELGYVVLVCLISPLIKERSTARKIIEHKQIQFLEVYISTPLQICEQRDVKGLYKKARQGEILNFTGIDSPYEIPTEPDINIDTTSFNVSESYSFVIQNIGLLA
jgi:adenylyl-sulfate kinase